MVIRPVLIFPDTINFPEFGTWLSLQLLYCFKLFLLVSLFHDIFSDLLGVFARTEELFEYFELIFYWLVLAFCNQAEMLVSDFVRIGIKSFLVFALKFLLQGFILMFFHNCEIVEDRSIDILGNIAIDCLEIPPPQIQVHDHLTRMFELLLQILVVYNEEIYSIEMRWFPLQVSIIAPQNIRFGLIIEDQPIVLMWQTFHVMVYHKLDGG